MPCRMSGNCRQSARKRRGGLKMRWRGERESENVEDRRGEGGGGFGFPLAGRRGHALSRRRRCERRRHRHYRHSDHSRLDVLLRRRPERHHAGRPAWRRCSGLPRHPAAAIAPRDDQLSGSQAAAGSGHPAPAKRERGRPQAIRRRGARRDRGCLAQSVRPLRRALLRSDARAVLRRRSLGLRHRHGADGAVLLSDGREGLYRPLLLRGAEEAVQRARRLRASLCHRA